MKKKLKQRTKRSTYDRDAEATRYAQGLAAEDVSVHCRCPGFHDGCPVDLQREDGRVHLGTLRVASDFEPMSWEEWSRTLDEYEDTMPPIERAKVWLFVHRWTLTVAAFLFTWLLLALD